jgi:hypothetical protein
VTATQNIVVGHEPATNAPVLMSVVRRPPPRHISTWEFGPNATQNEADGHETAPGPPFVMLLGVLHERPFHISDRPELSTASQNDDDTQDTESIWVVPSMSRGPVHPLPFHR